MGWRAGENSRRRVAYQLVPQSACPHGGEGHGRAAIYRGTGQVDRHSRRRRHYALVEVAVLRGAVRYYVAAAMAMGWTVEWLRRRGRMDECRRIDATRTMWRGEVVRRQRVGERPRLSVRREVMSVSEGAVGCTCLLSHADGESLWCDRSVLRRDIAER